MSCDVEMARGIGGAIVLVGLAFAVTVPLAWIEVERIRALSRMKDAPK